MKLYVLASGSERGFGILIQCFSKFFFPAFLSTSKQPEPLNKIIFFNPGKSFWILLEKRKTILPTCKCRKQSAQDYRENKEEKKHQRVYEAELAKDRGRDRQSCSYHCGKKPNFVLPNSYERRSSERNEDIENNVMLYKFLSVFFSYLPTRRSWLQEWVVYQRTERRYCISWLIT